MKILLIHKFLYPKGGAETYVLQLGELLTKFGHEVQYFGLENEKNTVGNKVGASVSDLDLTGSIWQNLHAPLRILYNGQARRKLRAVLEDFRPDVAHFNNIQYHLTPSVILEAESFRRAGHPLRLVSTAHDYQLLCPAHGLFDGCGENCEKCLGGNFTHCLRRRCIKGSFLKSFLGMVDAYLWKHSAAYDAIDTIICRSLFLTEKLDTQARFRGKTVTIHNFVSPMKAGAGSGGYVLEFGHLSRDKGTYTLIEAAGMLPQVRFVFAGFGEAEDAIKNLPNGEFVGFQQGKALRELIRNAAVSVCPSLCYENCPYSVMESQLLGTPVIGSRVGGIPELIREGETGELFQAGNARELAQKLRRLLVTPGLLETYRRNCREQTFETTDSYYQKLLDVYGGTYGHL